MTFSLQQPEIYTKESDQKTAYQAKIDDRLQELRDEMAQSGLTGQQKDDLIKAILLAGEKDESKGNTYFDEAEVKEEHTVYINRLEN